MDYLRQRIISYIADRGSTDVPVLLDTYLFLIASGATKEAAIGALSNFVDDVTEQKAGKIERIK